MAASSSPSVSSHKAPSLRLPFHLFSLNVQTLILQKAAIRAYLRFTRVSKFAHEIATKYGKERQIRVVFDYSKNAITVRPPKGGDAMDISVLDKLPYRFKCTVCVEDGINEEQCDRLIEALSKRQIPVLSLAFAGGRVYPPPDFDKNVFIRLIETFNVDSIAVHQLGAPADLISILPPREYQDISLSQQTCSIGEFLNVKSLNLHFSHFSIPPIAIIHMIEEWQSGDRELNSLSVSKYDDGDKAEFLAQIGILEPKLLWTGENHGTSIFAKVKYQMVARIFGQYPQPSREFESYCLKNHLSELAILTVFRSKSSNYANFNFFRISNDSTLAAYRERMLKLFD